MSEDTISVSQKLLEAAHEKIGAAFNGDIVPFLLAEVIGDTAPQSFGENLTGADMRDWVYHLTCNGLRVPYETMQPGDVGILQRTFEDEYWCYIVADVRERQYDVIIAKGIGNQEQTIITLETRPFPDFRDDWHTIAIFHFS